MTTDGPSPEGRGTVYFLGAGPGDPDLITVKGRRLIERCPVCLFAGSLVPRAVVAFAPEGAIVRNSASMDLDQIIALMDEATALGKDVARVHSGDPSLYGAIAEQMSRLDALEIPYEIVPGVTSVSAAAAALKIELTPAGRNQSVILTRASGRTGLPPNESLAEFARHGVGLCLFLSAAQMDEVESALIPAYGAEAPVVVVHRASWPDQRILRCRLDEVRALLAAEEITMTALVMVGPMLEEGSAESHLYRKTYTHTYRKSRQEGAPKDH